MHVHAHQDYKKAFAIGVVLNVVFVLVEAAYGVLSGSLALLADAGHNLTDVVGLLLAWIANVMATKPATKTHTYGYRRGTILASLFSALLLLVAVGALSWEAIGRFTDPAPVSHMTVITIASIGVVINTATAMLFVSGRKHDLNIRGAFLHMAADAAISLGVVASSLAMISTGWLWLDPGASLVIAAVILVGTWGLLRDSLHFLMDKVPPHIDPEEVEDYLKRIDGVDEVHDLHIWPVSTTETALTVHLVMPGGYWPQFLTTVSAELRAHFHIDHSTLQIEKSDDCQQYGNNW